MSLKADADALQITLQTWAEPRGGYAKVIPNQRHLWEELKVVSEEPRILIMFAGESKRGDEFRLYRYDRRWRIIVVRGRGFKAINVVEGRAETFFDDLEAIRDEVRKLVGITAADEWPPDYQGTDTIPGIVPSKEANAFMDAYMLMFQTAVDFAGIQLNDPAQDQVTEGQNEVV